MCDKVFQNGVIVPFLLGGIYPCEDPKTLEM